MGRISAKISEESVSQLLNPSSRLSKVIQQKVKDTSLLTASRPASLGVKHHLGPTTRFLLLPEICGFVYMGRPLWGNVWSVIYCRQNRSKCHLYLNFTCRHSTYSVVKRPVPCEHLLFTVFTCNYSMHVQVSAICSRLSIAAHVLIHVAQDKTVA